MESREKRRKSNLTQACALPPDSFPRPVSPSLRNCPFPQGPPTLPASAPTVHLRGAPGLLAPSRDRGLPKWAQLCKPRLNSPRPGWEPLPATQRFPSSHPQIHSTSLLAAAAVAATRARPPLGRLRTSSSPGHGAQLAANGVAAAQYRGAAHTITAPRRPAARAAREWGAPGGPGTSS